MAMGIDWAAWGYVGLFLAAFGAAIIIPFIPSEPVIVALAAQDAYEPMALVIVGSAGNTLGACVNWIAGLYIEHLKDRSWFPISQKAMDRAESWYARWGVWSLLFAWLPVVGDPLTLAAGLMRARLVWFLPLVAVGKTARYAALVYLGGELGDWL